MEAKADGDSSDQNDERGHSQSRNKIPGHRIEEHLIVQKSIIQKRINMNEGIVIQLVDYKKFFLIMKD